jgi:hypothetical protein
MTTLFSWIEGFIESGRQVNASPRHLASPMLMICAVKDVTVPIDRFSIVDFSVIGEVSSCGWTLFI